MLCRICIQSVLGNLECADFDIRYLEILAQKQNNSASHSSSFHTGIHLLSQLYLRVLRHCSEEKRHTKAEKSPLPAQVREEKAMLEGALAGLQAQIKHLEYCNSSARRESTEGIRLASLRR